MGRESATKSASAAGATAVPQVDYKFKVLLLGDSAVGKTCILGRCLRGKEASLSTLSTVGVDLQLVRRRVDGHMVTLQVWDTAGQEKFRSLAESFFRGADGAIVCYDLTRKVSFLSLKSWLSSLSKFVDACDVVVVGNKLDLAGESREVATSAGQAAAEELRAGFYETSAATGENVEDAFDAIARALVARRIKAATTAEGGASDDPKGGKRASVGGATNSATAWKDKSKEVDLVDLAARPIQEEGAGGCGC